MARETYYTQSLGSLYDRIKESRVLMVGAGGIGCELLKNLVLTGFGEIHIVDLDTIDLSNLNRQFLFRQEHIKKPKALVAKEIAGKFNPNVKLEAYHANIKEPTFNIDWFLKFDVVFNALDNLEARRHVNKMCLAADVPLIDGGTTGFLGHVQIIKKGLTECYDCYPKETPKSFPVCTIRSTPSQPIHCIVWAKSYLFTEIFGTSEDDAPELDHSEDAQNSEEIEKLRQEAQALKRIRQSMGSSEFGQKIFEKVFVEDILRLRAMEDMWKNRKAPEPLDFDRVSKDASDVDASVTRKDQVVWNLVENYVVFADSLKRLTARLQDAQADVKNGDAQPILTFDKDDVDTLDFVTASANLRSLIFGIETKSKFDTKQMAGNIIPAIATTNAMVAGLCVLEAFKVLRKDYASGRKVFISHGSADRAISSETLRPPNPDCTICGVAQTRLLVDTSRATLNDLVEDILRLQLGYGDEFSVNNEVGTLYDPELDDNLAKKLSDLGIKSDSFLTVVDEDEENPRVNLVLSISEKSMPAESKPIVYFASVDIARKPRKAETANGDALSNGHSNGLNGVAGKKKRSAEEAGLEEEQPTKKGKVKKDDGTIVLDDEDETGNGAIEIEDD